MMQTHTTMQRPAGPRNGPRPPPRSPSPSPNPPFLETPPLVINKGPKPTLDSSLSPPAAPHSRSTTPLTLNIPRSRSRTPTPKPHIQIAIPLAPQIADGYYGGGPKETAAQNSGGSADDGTIRPADQATAHPASSETTGPLSDIRGLVNELDALPASSSSHLNWSDDVLEVISRLGEGAGGAVHKVKDKRTGKIIARKTITTREAPMKQLLRELSIISSTKHVNIIQFHGAYMSPSSSEVKILMDYCEGGSLEAVGKRIKERGAIVGEKIAGRLAEGVLQGLAYLHTKKTIHRDIKPSNILLSRQGIVKLCDFGVSGELVGSLAYTFTGTSFYMAPERITGHKYSIRSDVWSTGISLLELVQNRFPFPSDLPPIELMMYITAGEPPQLEDEEGVQWSDDMKDFIKQALTVDATRRPTPKDMLMHPWIVGVMKQEVHMHKWIRQVWGWKKSDGQSRDDASLSRPSTADGRPSSSHRSDSPESLPKSDGS